MWERLAEWVLSRRLRRSGGTRSVVRLMVGARDGRVAAAAERALTAAWENDPAAPRRIWAELPGTPEPALRFLLAPAPDSRHQPRVRLVAAPPDGGRVLRTALESPDASVREALATVLRATDHPLLLGDLESALREGP